ncbi:hypothetical protein EIP91_011938 [Steccherinum ochraceum]|uniref:Uncharacterized protein n=1 Tax=Steccherinum ochraceum TaxID=92696 RepID=A0A4R0RH60_9APHY|nr:hypothetical protein EIP91_011938 [Steccherinum ochraceum]
MFNHNSYGRPVEDTDNPCYCPSIPALTYLQSLRPPLISKNPNALAIGPKTSRHFKTKTKSRSARFARMLSRAHLDPQFSPSGELIPSFTDILNESLDEHDLLALKNAVQSPATRTDENLSVSSYVSSAYFAPSWEKKTGSSRLHLPSASASKQDRARAGSQGSSTFSDLRGPAKHQRSSVSVNEDSFELSAKADRLNFFPPGSRRKTRPKEWFSPYGGGSGSRVRDRQGVLTASEARRKMRMLEDELYGPPVGTESPRGLKSLILRIDALLPGARMKEKLYALEALTHQRIVDVLSMDGNLNTRVLNLLRMSELESLDMTASMTDEEGLNLDAHELLLVFAKPNSFLFLNEINLSGAKLEDVDIRHIHHLPRLAKLWISNTGIGNEAIYLLVPLKRTLAELDVAFNPAITDDCIPALLILRKLRFLTLLGTEVGMPGLRKFCAVARSRKQSLELEVPRECEIYVERMGRQYILQPEAPLITDPAAVPTLSIKALKANLSAHAEHNVNILSEGSKPELAERLTKLLEQREQDLAVREVTWRGGEEDETQEEDEEEMDVDVDGGVDEDGNESDRTLEE